MEYRAKTGPASGHPWEGDATRFAVEAASPDDLGNLAWGDDDDAEVKP